MGNRLHALRVGSAARSRSALAALLLAASGCADEESARLATECVRASRDPHVLHTASLLSDAEVSREDGLVVVRTRVPVGIGMDLRIRFRHWTYRCRERGGRLEFVDYARD